MVTFLVFVLVHHGGGLASSVRALESGARRSPKVLPRLIRAGRRSIRRRKRATPSSPRPGFRPPPFSVKAEERAQSVVDQAVGDGKHKAELLLTQAHEELEAQLKSAQRELYNEIAGLALKAAGQVVQEDLDDDKHRKLVNTLVKSWS